ncbi:hypothetical protein ACFE04_031233 [Oxalis oulophora]
MDEYEAIQSQATIFKSLSGIAHSMAMKCAIDLRLADILHSHENPIALSLLASSIDSSTPPDVSALKCVMRLLVRDQIFTAHEPADGGETLYGATKISLWLLRDSEKSLSSLVSMCLQPSTVTPWCYLSECVKQGGSAFEKVHGCELFEFASKNPDFNELFNNALVAPTKQVIKSIVKQSKEAFENVGSLVDVGGGTGQAIAIIVNEIPHINGINFDLPHVVSTAPEWIGVKQVGGNMFESIPKADAIFLKTILHNWSDKQCVEILKKCKEAIPKERGKILIVERVLNPEGSHEYDEAKSFFNLLMLVNHGSKERNQYEWKKLLEDGGFPRYEIIEVDPTHSLITAYPE